MRSLGSVARTPPSRPPPTPAVVSLFNTISAHQKSVAAATASEVHKGEDVRAAAAEERLRPATNSHSFLDLLHQNQGVTRAGAAPQAAAAGEGSGGAGGGGGGGGGGSKWAVLTEGYHTSKAAKAAGKVAEEEEDALDILASDDE